MWLVGRMWGGCRGRGRSWGELWGEERREGRGGGEEGRGVREGSRVDGLVDGDMMGCFGLEDMHQKLSGNMHVWWQIV